MMKNMLSGIENIDNFASFGISISYRTLIFSCGRIRHMDMLNLTKGGSL